MENQTKEVLLHRILSGINIIKVDNKNYYFKTPSRLIKYKAALYYEELYNDNMFNEWMTREEAEQHLINLSILSPAYKEEIERLNNEIDDLKLDCFKNVFQFDRLKLFRRKLSEQKNNLHRLLNTVNLIDRFTLEGYCDIQKYQYIITNCIFNEADIKINVEQTMLEKIISKLAENSISMSDYRELARTEPWRSYWNSSKENIYGIPGADWNEEQKTIVLFAKMYENAYKHPECPSDMIISDDDLFDGWSISETRKIEEDKKKRDIGNDKFGNAGEVFIMAKNEKEVKQIYGTNDIQSKMIIKQRQEALGKAGKLTEAELPDVKKELQMKANKLMMEKRR